MYQEVFGVVSAPPPKSANIFCAPFDNVFIGKSFAFSSRVHELVMQQLEVQEPPPSTPAA
ncbi:unnamed protein product [Ceratitis capitata]|uniref:(Mediterranean fruit fly) hypothetical protein n=1 Tax=Ceratitis capitata TaxID=7213 RepID=A0A811VI73_CERCA|nr:unnamed protein product [Ceratitis capitata]